MNHPQKSNFNNFIKVNTLPYYRKTQSVIVTLAFLCIIFYKPTKVNAQNFRTTPSYDCIFYGGNLGLSALNLTLTSKLNATPHRWTVSGIDGLAQSTLNPTYVKVSDATAAGTLLMSGAMALMLPKNQSYPYLNCLVQNVWLTANLTQIVKITVQRSRPYTQGTGYLGTKDDNYSFFSGHSAITSSAASTAIVFALQSNNPWLKSVAYGTGVLAIGTAGLRIAAGKHYPSDVLTGILIGTAVGIINTRLHKS